MRDIFELGPHLAELRMEAGLRLVDLGAETGVNKEMLSDYEKCAVVPSLKTLRKIATALPFRVEEWATPLVEYHRHKRYSRQAEEARARKVPRAQKAAGPSLGDICRAARAAGMTYGDYVAKHSDKEG